MPPKWPPCFTPLLTMKRLHWIHLVQTMRQVHLHSRQGFQDAKSSTHYSTFVKSSASAHLHVSPLFAIKVKVTSCMNFACASTKTLTFIASSEGVSTTLLQWSWGASANHVELSIHYSIQGYCIGPIPAVLHPWQYIEGNCEKDVHLEQVGCL